jgi:hypothetical protein
MASYFNCSKENGKKLSIDEYLNLVNEWEAEMNENV